MIWWVLTFLYIDRTQLTLFIRAHTNFPDHLFMKWSVYEPARSPIWRTLRGKPVFCGYKYIWDTPFLTEQQETGDTIEHTFFLEYLLPQDHIWFYLCSPAERPGREIQGPLIHVPPQELAMPSARILRTTPIAVPHGGGGLRIPWEAAVWDNGAFFDPADPTKLTIAISGRYITGVCLSMAAGNPNHLSVNIFVNFVTPILHFNVPSPIAAYYPPCVSCSTLWALTAGDFLEANIYQDSGGPINLTPDGHNSPNFWIQRVS